MFDYILIQTFEQVTLIYQNFLRGDNHGEKTLLMSSICLRIQLFDAARVRRRHNVVSLVTRAKISSKSNPSNWVYPFATRWVLNHLMEYQSYIWFCKSFDNQWFSWKISDDPSAIDSYIVSSSFMVLIHWGSM